MCHNSQELSQFSHGVVYRYGEGLSSALCQADFSSFNMVGFWESCPEIIDKVYIFSEGQSNLKKKSPNFFLMLLNKFKKVGRFFQNFWNSQNIYFDVFNIFIPYQFSKNLQNGG